MASIGPSHPTNLRRSRARLCRASSFLGHARWAPPGKSRYGVRFTGFDELRWLPTESGYQSGEERLRQRPRLRLRRSAAYLLRTRITASAFQEQRRPRRQRRPAAYRRRASTGRGQFGLHAGAPVRRSRRRGRQVLDAQRSRRLQRRFGRRIGRRPRAVERRPALDVTLDDRAIAARDEMVDQRIYRWIGPSRLATTAFGVAFDRARRPASYIITPALFTRTLRSGKRCTTSAARRRSRRHR